MVKTSELKVLIAKSYLVIRIADTSGNSKGNMNRALLPNGWFDRFLGKLGMTKWVGESGFGWGVDEKRE